MISFLELVNIPNFLSDFIVGCLLGDCYASSTSTATSRKQTPRLIIMISLKLGNKKVLYKT